MPGLPTVFRTRRALLGLAAAALSGTVAGCGGGLDVEQPDRATATLFNQRCSGCHSLKPANSYGSKPEKLKSGGERTNGPNFDTRKVDVASALFAIRNGGFSGAIMPANIVVGDDARALASFVGKYSGREMVSP